MANKSRFFIAEGSIKTFFKNVIIKSYSKEHLGEIFEQNRMSWNLPAFMTAEKFSAKLLSSNILIKKEIEFSGFLDKKERLVTTDASVFQVAASLINKSYLSHFSAAYLLGLTLQVPKTIYITFEQSKKLNPDRELLQTAIDSAFSKPQRRSATTAIYDGYTLIVHNGMHSSRMGVYQLNDLPVTNIERTLIDIAVRPNYAGGVDSVLDIYRKAISKISINKLLAILDNLNFIYPYHQSIGFYLEKAGYDNQKLNVLKSKKMIFDFYLTYEMDEKLYSNDWRIYYPKNL